MSYQPFRYAQKTIDVGPYTFDAEALNAFIARAESGFGSPKIKWELNVDAGNPNKPIEQEEALILDCTGYVWWSTYRKRRAGGLWDSNPNAGWQKNWVEVPYPIPGAAVRHGAPPGMKSGHAGFVVSTYNGTFQTLDSSETKTPPRKGSIRFTSDGKKRWYRGPNTAFVVSKDALLAVDGKPFKRDLNLALAAAKRPIATASLSFLLVAAIAWLSYRKYKGLPLLPSRRTA
jgi:hypothetical protein